MRQFIQQKTIVIYGFVFLICMGIACKEIEYVEPFRWGTMKQNFNLNGKVATVVDSIYNVEYLIQTQTYIEHPENKKFLFLAEGTVGGYPSSISYKGYDDYVQFPLDTAYNVVFFIDPNTHIFNKANVIINGQTFNGILRYPSSNSFSLLSVSNSERVINILEISYDDSFRITDYSSWTSISIVRKRIKYATFVTAESSTSEFDVIIANEARGVGKLEKNASGLVTKMSITQKINDKATSYTYIYSDIDNSGNYRKVEIRKDDITIARIERTITYH